MLPPTAPVAPETPVFPDIPPEPLAPVTLPLTPPTTPPLFAPPESELPPAGKPLMDGKTVKAAPDMPPAPPEVMELLPPEPPPPAVPPPPPPIWPPEPLPSCPPPEPEAVVPGTPLIDGSTVKTPLEVPDPEVLLLDEPEAAPPDAPVPLVAAKTGAVPKGLVKPFARGCVIAAGVMPKPAAGDPPGTPFSPAVGIELSAWEIAACCCAAGLTRVWPMAQATVRPKKPSTAIKRYPSVALAMYLHMQWSFPHQAPSPTIVYRVPASVNARGDLL
jgi:hypothetical protein